jgi:hypothetical protein
MTVASTGTTCVPVRKVGCCDATITTAPSCSAAMSIEDIRLTGVPPVAAASPGRDTHGDAGIAVVGPQGILGTDLHFGEQHIADERRDLGAIRGTARERHVLLGRHGTSEAFGYVPARDAPDHPRCTVRWSRIEDGVRQPLSGAPHQSRDVGVHCGAMGPEDEDGELIDVHNRVRLAGIESWRPRTRVQIPSHHAVRRACGGVEPEQPAAGRPPDCTRAGRGHRPTLVSTMPPVTRCAQRVSSVPMKAGVLLRPSRTMAR